MKRRAFLKSSSVAMAAVVTTNSKIAATQKREAAEGRPNILFIMSDQQRRDTLGCYGNTLIRTPHLDRLACGGVIMERMYTTASVCSPSRASLFTGRFPNDHRLRTNGMTLPPDQITFPQIL